MSRTPESENQSHICHLRIETRQWLEMKTKNIFCALLFVTKSYSMTWHYRLQSTTINSIDAKRTDKGSRGKDRDEKIRIVGSDEDRSLYKRRRSQWQRDVFG